MDVSVVIPVFNGERTLVELHAEVSSCLQRDYGESYEIVLVNDGSSDGSWKRICEIAAENSRVIGIDLVRNYGQHNALLCGIREAAGDVIVTMDDDLQHPPHEISRLIAKVNDGWDVVYGTPAHHQHGLWRNLASRITRFVLRIAAGVKNVKDVSAFRAFKGRSKRGFEHYCGPSVSIDVLLSWGAVRFGSVAVRHDQRRYGVSNYSFTKLLAHALDMMTGFSALPLRLASLVGFGATVFGLVILSYVLVRYIMSGGSVPGFPFLASIISIFSGAQLFALGIIGEYLARMHFRTMQRPTYAVAERVGNVGCGHE